MTNISLSRSDCIRLASQMLFPAQSLWREDSQLTILRKKNPINKKKKAEYLEVMERKLELNQQHESDRWTYSTVRKFLDFHALAVDTKERYEKAKLAGRVVQHIEKTIPDSIEIFPCSNIEDGLTYIIVPTDQLESLVAPVPSLIQQRIEEASLWGQLSGAILVCLYHMNEGGPSVSGLSIARRVCLKHANKQYHLDRGRPKNNSEKLLRGLSEENIEIWWAIYRPVAHWWAAYVSLDDLDLLPIEMPITEENVGGMIQRARFFAKFGTKAFTSDPNRCTPLWPNELYWPPGLSRDASEAEVASHTDIVSERVKELFKALA